MIASVRFFETPKIRAVSYTVTGRLLSTLIGCRIWLLYAGPTIHLLGFRSGTTGKRRKPQWMPLSPVCTPCRHQSSSGRADPPSSELFMLKMLWWPSGPPQANISETIGKAPARNVSPAAKLCFR